MITIDAKKLKQALSRVMFAAARNEQRPALTGILFTSDGNELTLVGADGFRLSECKLTVDNSSLPMLAIVPLDTLREITKAITRNTDMVYIVLHGNIISFMIDNYPITGEIVNAHYPDYSAIVPTSYITKVLFDCKQLLAAIKQTDIVILSINSTAITINDKRVNIISMAGVDVAVRLDAKKLAQALRQMGASAILEIITPRSVVVIRPGSKDEQQFVHLLMPARDW